MTDPHRGEQTRFVARSIAANLDSLRAEGVGCETIEKVAAICRILQAFQIDSLSRGELVRQLRRHLVGADGLTARTVIGWLDDIDSLL